MKDSKNIVIAALIVTLTFMAAGYAAFAQQLDITGTAAITGAWQVEITGIDPVYVGTASDTTGKPSYTTTTATFDTKLLKPGDTATYTITVANNGSIPASLSGVTLSPNDGGSTAITHRIVSQPTVGTVLAPGATTEVVIEVAYDANATALPTVTTKSFTGTIEYVQATN